jgi:hypothetical protein
MDLKHETEDGEKLAAKAHNAFATLYHVRNATLLLEVALSVGMFVLYHVAAKWHRDAAKEHERKAKERESSGDSCTRKH